MKLFARHYDRPGKGIDRDAPPKKGIARFWEILQVEYQQLIPLSLLFTLTCIPIITIPTALTAMSGITLSMVEDQPRFLWHDYFRIFQREWKRASVLGWFMILAAMVSGYAFNFYQQMGRSIVWAKALCILAGVITVLLLVMNLYIYPMLAKTDLPLKTIFKNAFLLLFVKGSGLRILAAVCLIMGLLLLALTALPFTILLLPLLFFSFMGLIASFSVYEIVKVHVFRC